MTSRKPVPKPSPRLKKEKKRLGPNRKRKASRFRRNFHSQAFVEWTKRQPCAICGEAPRQWWNRERWGNDCAHVEGRKMGGCGGDWTKIIPACPPCHDAGKPTGEYALANEHNRRWRVESMFGEAA